VAAIHHAHRCRKTATQALLVLFERPVNLLHHVLEVLGLEVAQDLHGGALDLFDVADCRGGPVVHGHDAVHHVVVALFVSGHHFLYHFVHFGDAVVYDLDAVVQVGELVLLAADARRENVFEHLRDVGVVGGLALFVGFLLVGLLRGVVLLLVPGAAAVGLFARV
jgi:hypothetical protein